MAPALYTCLCHRLPAQSLWSLLSHMGVRPPAYHGTFQSLAQLPNRESAEQ